MYLLGWVSDAVLKKMNEIGRAKLSKASERFGSGINRLVEDLLGNSGSRLAMWMPSISVVLRLTREPLARP